jgi:GGDEF domain-containing protein
MDVGSLRHVTAVLGFQESDAVLKRMGRLLTIYWPTWSATRVASDEFALLAPNLDAARTAAARLQELAEKEFEPQRDEVRANAAAKDIVAPPSRLLRLSIAIVDLVTCDSLKEGIADAECALNDAIVAANGTDVLTVVARSNGCASIAEPRLNNEPQ